MSDWPITDVAAQLRAERIARGLTQKALGASSGIGQNRICAWETGYGAPGLRNLTRWAAALGLEVTVTAADRDRQSQDERDEDIRAVARLLNDHNDTVAAWGALRDRFAGRIATLEQRDAARAAATSDPTETSGP